MSQLYTVEMFRNKFVYSYDPDTGRRVNERIETISYVITDLPHSAAIAYQFRFPHNGVKITRQAMTSEAPVRTARRDYYERADDAPAHVTSEDIAPAIDTVEAAISGDLGAALGTEAA
jgi:hypothetical protein